MSNTKQPISANKDYTKDEAEKLFKVKQPPAELVEKMAEAWKKPDFGAQCTQIALQHAEKENRELREFIETLLNSGQLDEYYIEKAEQLLNKNEDGKE